MAVTPMTTTSVASLIDRHIVACDKSLYCIARESGFPMSNIISMIRTGKMKLPLDKVPALANSLGINARHLLETALKEYRPELWRVINELLLDSDTDAGDGLTPACAWSPVISA